MISPPLTGLHPEALPVLDLTGQRGCAPEQEERHAAGTGWTDNGLVFTIPNGKPLDPGNLTRRFRLLLHRAELRTIRLHDLRHSTATLLLEQGVDLVVIKELLGHAHIGVTAGVYAHVRLRLQDLLGNTLRSPDQPTTQPDDGDEPLLRRHPAADVVVNYCRHGTQKPCQSRLPRHRRPRGAGPSQCCR